MAASTFIEGILLTSIFVSISIYLTETTDESMRGRVFGSIDAIEQSFMAMSMTLASATCSVFILPVVYCFGVVLMLVAALYAKSAQARAANAPLA